MQVPFRDLSRVNGPIQEEVDAAVLELIHSNKFILGEPVAAFEKDLAAYLGRAHAVGTACGTDSIQLALQAAGVGSGDRVMAPTFTLNATVEGIHWLGATPVFLDIDEDTFNVDPEEVWKYLEGTTPLTRPKALIVVHLYGQSADMDPILDICRHYGVKVIEDCCQALSASYPSRHGTMKVGKMGLMSCFSFFPTKPLGAYGDAGAIVTDDPELDAHLRKLRQHGWDMKEKYVNYDIGLNSRMDAIQAVVLKTKLPYLDDWTFQVRRIAAGYNEYLHVDTPRTPYGEESHTYHLYTIRVKDPVELKARLTEAGVASDFYFPVLMTDQPAFRQYLRNGPSVPVAKHVGGEILSIPIYPGLTSEEQKYVIDSVNANV